MSRLMVNLDQIAALREARRARQPDPVLAAGIAELAGADGITVHLRSDRRHIKERDLELLRASVKTRLNIEISATQEMFKIAREIKPERVTLVPERPEEVNTEGGLDLLRLKDALAKDLPFLLESGMQVALLIEPDIDQVKAAHKLNVDQVELYAARYCDAKTEVDRYQIYNRILEATRMAEKLRVQVSLAHGLDYQTIRHFHGIKALDEFGVGQAIVARAALVGLDRAVRDMAELVR